MGGLLDRLTQLDLWIYVAMGFIYLLGIGQCVFPLAAVSGALKRASKKLRERSADGAYKYADSKFLACRYIDDWWERYIVNLAEMRKSNGDCDVADFINVQTVIQGPSHSQFADILPGVMTSLGILGTFYGLVQGLSQLNLSTSEEMNQTIRVLISGMNTAFYTSIAGVICAVSFQLIRRFAISRSSNTLNRFIKDCQMVISQPYTQDTKLIQVVYAILMEIRKGNEVPDARRH